MQNSPESIKTTIYVLKLGNNKYYVGRIGDYGLKERLAKYAAGGGSKWVKKHGFVEWMYYFEGDEFSELNETLKLMNRYGLENVRGASFNADSEELIDLLFLYDRSIKAEKVLREKALYDIYGIVEEA